MTTNLWIIGVEVITPGSAFHPYEVCKTMNNKISEGEPRSPVREKTTSERGAFESPPTADEHPPFSLHPIELRQLNK